MTTRSVDSDIADNISSTNRLTGGTGSLPPPVSTNQKILKRFLKHKLAIFGLAMLGVMYFSILFAEFLVPYGEASADRGKPYASPSNIHFMHKGQFVGPFIYNY